VEIDRLIHQQESNIRDFQRQKRYEPQVSRLQNKLLMLQYNRERVAEAHTESIRAQAAYCAEMELRGYWDERE
jgi:hypothetical protein